MSQDAAGSGVPASAPPPPKAPALTCRVWIVPHGDPESFDGQTHIDWAEGVPADDRVCALASLLVTVRDGYFKRSSSALAAFVLTMPSPDKSTVIPLIERR